MIDSMSGFRSVSRRQNSDTSGDVSGRWVIQAKHSARYSLVIVVINKISSRSASIELHWLVFAYWFKKKDQITEHSDSLSDLIRLDISSSEKPG